MTTQEAIEKAIMDNRPFLDLQVNAILGLVEERVREERERVKKLAMDSFMTHEEGWGSYCDTGADMEWACRSDCTEHGAKRFLTALGGTKE